MVFPFLLPLLSAGAGYAMGGDLKSALLGGLLGFLPGAAGALGGGAASGAAAATKTGLDAILAAGGSAAGTAAATAAPSALTALTASGASPAAIAAAKAAMAVPGLSTAPASLSALGKGVLANATPGAAQAADLALFQELGNASKAANLLQAAPSAAQAPTGIEALGDRFNNWAQNNKPQAAMLAGTLGSTLAMKPPENASASEREPSNEPPHVLPQGPAVPYTGVNASQGSTYTPDVYTSPHAASRPDLYSQFPNSQEHVFIPEALKDNWMADVQKGSITPNTPTSGRRRSGLGKILGLNPDEEREFRDRFGLADGGPIKGPGTTRSDSIPAATASGDLYALSNNEHVLPADYVKLRGKGNYDRGHAAIMKEVARARKAAFG